MGSGVVPGLLVRAPVNVEIWVNRRHHASTRIGSTPIREDDEIAFREACTRRHEDRFRLLARELRKLVGFGVVERVTEILGAGVEQAVRSAAISRAGA